MTAGQPPFQQLELGSQGNLADQGNEFVKAGEHIPRQCLANRHGLAVGFRGLDGDADPLPVAEWQRLIEFQHAVFAGRFAFHMHGTISARYPAGDQ